MSDSASAGYERRDLNVRAVAWFIAGLAAALFGILIILDSFQASLGGSHSSRVTHPPHHPAPQLQASPGNAAAWRKAQEDALNRCRWVDRKAGIIEIPIEQAMELLTVRGLPARQPPSGKGGTP